MQAFGCIQLIDHLTFIIEHFLIAPKQKKSFLITVADAECEMINVICSIFRL